MRLRVREVARCGAMLPRIPACRVTGMGKLFNKPDSTIAFWLPTNGK
jgi:hypothetical protein